MKNSFCTTVISLLLCFFLGGQMQIQAQDNKPILVKPVKDDGNRKDRPRVPALYSGVTAEYDGTMLTITFGQPEGDAGITVTDYNDEVIYTGFADTCAPIPIMTGEISGQTEIFISTSAGNTYIGYLYAQ